MARTGLTGLGMGSNAGGNMQKSRGFVNRLPLERQGICDLAKRVTRRQPDEAKAPGDRAGGLLPACMGVASRDRCHFRRTIFPTDRKERIPSADRPSIT